MAALKILMYLLIFLYMLSDSHVMLSRVKPAMATENNEEADKDCNMVFLQNYCTVKDNHSSRLGQK
ncbi:hypothetical protein XELAEV_18029387mg [Xenopus laevis]|uniref:Phytosulfokine-beta n=1 Tax=Xenopus laevis TaxID=8355 RepID=A0A974CRI0_XENLA|nr:hypothetical protein XELAEV_18029387mg [Xenopus laevis]